jgi:hypothetical protein
MIETLVIPLALIVRDELRDDMPEVPLTDWNDAFETLFLDRPDESLGVTAADGACRTRLRWRRRRRLSREED